MPLQYQHDYTRRKGWYRFATWKENFQQNLGIIAARMDAGEYKVGQEFSIKPMSSLDYWVQWLPEEVVEAQFCIVPPIMRDAERIESKVRQIVAMERNIQQSLVTIDSWIGDKTVALDEAFVQNEHACIYPSPCACYSLCYTHGVAESPADSGLYQPRVDHHGSGCLR